MFAVLQKRKSFFAEGSTAKKQAHKHFRRRALPRASQRREPKREDTKPLSLSSCASGMIKTTQRFRVKENGLYYSRTLQSASMLADGG